MSSSNEYDEEAFNMVLFKKLRFYHFFDPDSPKILNVNVYQLALVLSLMISLTNICVLGLLQFWFYIKIEDTTSNNDFFGVLYAILNTVLSTCKIIIFVYNANKIWGLLDVTRINFLTSKRCLEHTNIFQEYRRLSIKITDFLIDLAIMLLLMWFALPLFFNMFQETSDDSTHIKENLSNLQFPVSVQNYNRYYFIFYTIEAIQAVLILYPMMMLDILLISISCVLIAHYEIHTRAYENIGNEQGIQNGDDKHCYDHYEDFKSIICDQQKLQIKLEVYYSIMKPIVIMTVVVTSCSIILSSYSIAVTCLTGQSLSVLYLIKLIIPFSFLTIELFFNCYLLETLNAKRESVILGIYSCNWTGMNLKFKKLLLLTMRMNCAHRLIIQITPAKIINLNFFANIMLTCYNVVSVLLKTQNKIN